jgi:HlyD family secretion protein
MKRRTTIIIAVTLLFAVASSIALARISSTSRKAEWATIATGDLVLGVEVNGALEAVESVSIGPPLVDNQWDYKIAMIAPEGNDVKKGMPVVSFDTSELARRLETVIADRDTARQEIDRKRAELRLQTEDEQLKVAEAEARLRKAEMKAAAPDDVIGRNERREAELDAGNARRELDYRKARLTALQNAATEELRQLAGRLQTASSEVEAIQRGIATMTIQAPRDGTIVYSSSRRGEKRKVGDSVWRGETILQIPSLEVMRARGEIEEADAAKIAVGQRVTLRLDAHPDDEWQGTVRNIARTVQRQSHVNPLKILKVEIELDETDRARMRPGMRFRGRIETGRLTDLLLIPTAAIRTAGERPVALVSSLAGEREVPLELGRRNSEFFEVVSGLAPGDRVVLRKKEREGETQ